MAWATSTYLAIAAIVASAASSYVNYTQSEKTADRQEAAQEEANKREAAIASQQAAEEEERGRKEAEQVRKQAARIKAAQEAALAGAGVKLATGTALDITEETEKLSELDALAALKEAGSRANLLRSRAGNLLATDVFVPRSSLLATGLTMVGQGLQSYNQYKGTQKTGTQKTGTQKTGTQETALV